MLLAHTSLNRKYTLIQSHTIWKGKAERGMVMYSGAWKNVVLAPLIPWILPDPALLQVLALISLLSDTWSAWQIKGLVLFPSWMLTFLSQLDHELLKSKNHLFSFLLSSKALNKCWLLVATGFSLTESWWFNNWPLYRENKWIQSIIGVIWSFWYICGGWNGWIIVLLYR